MLALEVLYRVLDPFPYFTEEKINSTEYGNLTTFDETLGWKGVANGMGEFVTQNNRVRLTHNRQGNRDVEHEDVSTKKPAIVFLGDSFTWGHEVEFDEMFVNRLRDRLPAYEIFNLAQRGYGTDQELISFRNWADSRQLRLVALVFCENDIEDNNSEFRYDKPKPRYRLKNDALVLTGVPLPRVEAWTNPRPGKDAPESWLRRLPKLLFQFLLIGYIDNHTGNNSILKSGAYHDGFQAPGFCGDYRFIVRDLLFFSKEGKEVLPVFGLIEWHYDGRCKQLFRGLALEDPYQRIIRIQKLSLGCRGVYPYQRIVHEAPIFSLG